MIKINLVCVGDIKEQYLRDAIKEYSKRLNRFCKLNIIEIKENVATSSSEQDCLRALKKDAIEIKKHLSNYNICLDIEGKEFSSPEFAKKIQSLTLKTGELTFIIGASNGHQLMRVIFLEQLYRAFTILNNIAYHK